MKSDNRNCKSHLDFTRLEQELTAPFPFWGAHFKTCWFTFACSLLHVECTSALSPKAEVLKVSVKVALDKSCPSKHDMSPMCKIKLSSSCSKKPKKQVQIIQIILSLQHVTNIKNHG